MDHYEAEMLKACEQIRKDIAALEATKERLAAQLCGIEKSLQMYREISKGGNAAPTKQDARSNQDIRWIINGTQRRSIFKLLEDDYPNGLTLEQIVTKAQEKGIKVNVATVQSHLSRALSNGEVSKDEHKKFTRFPVSKND